MGITKRCTMTLLTTLAALIIIVHCVEEDLDTDYQHELRPRILETRKSTYDESWRTREATSTLQRPRNTDDWKEGSPDEPLKRRRPGRKRKRRPQTAPVDELIQQEEISYPDEPLRPYHDFESEKNRDFIEEPKLRRKKPEEKPIRWTDDDFTALERPHRRKSGPRRNKPSLQRAPDVNEFREMADINQDVPDVKVEPQDIVRTNSDQVHKHENIYENTPELTDDITKDIKSENNFEFKAPTSETLNNEQVSEPQITEDKSLSEFSMETLKKPGALRHKFKFPRRHKIKTPSLMQDHDNEKENMDPITLKDILKRSNGSSLSEILQQHNLSLTDLLHGKEEAVSIFKNLESTEDHRKDHSEIANPISYKQIETKTDVKDESEEPVLIKSDTKYATESVREAATEYLITTEATQAEIPNEKEIDGEPTTAVKPLVESTTKIRRRFPVALRKKLRMKPVVNASTTQKGQLSRDLITLNNRKYTQLRRNTTKSKEWKDVILNKRQNIQEDNTNTTTAPETTTQQIITPEETTIAVELVDKIISLEEPQPNINLNLADIEMDVTETIPPVTETTTEDSKNITEKSLGVVTMTRPTAVSLGLRRTALNNRLKRKRMKQKNSTTESPQDDLLKNLYGMGNLVSSSEFIAKTQQPSTTLDDSKDFTTIQDFMTTESIKTTLDEATQTETTMFTTEMMPTTTIKTTTIEPAKIEIEEILNDTHILSQLSEILTERNMTLEELIAHRERGSSRIHLADIFHNNSRESNPPEPFLTKSLLEPISKETYPLRVLLDANLHDQNGKITAMDPELVNNLNIPIVMDYGNNVNENAENMGIMSLFNNYTKNITKIMLPPATNDTNANTLDNIPNATSTIETARESRVLENNEDDVVNWNEILSLMSTAKANETEEILLETPFKKLAIEDIDEDGLLALEDLQRLKDLDKPMGSELNGNIELNFANADPGPQEKGFLDNIPSQTTSVTVATASIVGLGMILFLLTYIGFKCKQQRSIARKKASFSEERIPTPVFETRIGHKNNSSIRSISPIMQTSNIYSVNTLDSHNCDESGEYIWDSMRQPYQ